MERLFWFSLLLTYLPVTESTEQDEVCISQQNTVMWGKLGQSAVLPCTISPPYLESEWFSVKEKSHHRLEINGSHKYKLNGASLVIESLHANDSGIYHCAAVGHGPPKHRLQYVGLGTTLVVRENVQMMRDILLWVSFVLLFIYSLAVITLILKKHGCNMSTCRRRPKTDKVFRNNSTKKRQFRDVLQEMYGRGNFVRSKRTSSRDRSEVEVTSPDMNNSTEDVYQNV